MQTKFLASLLIAGALGAGAAAAAPINAVGYSLGNNGSTLVTMTDLTMPGMASGTPLTFGGEIAQLSALAYRPQTAQLYGYSNQENAVYLIDVRLGTMAFQASNPIGTNVEALGFDFNNAIDAARIVTADNQNFVYSPAMQTVTQFTDLFYGAGDINEGADPSIIGNAYTNAVPDASSTVQFVIDSQLDALATLANNEGTLTTVGTFTLDGRRLDFGDDGDIDILSFSEGDNTAFALLTTATGQGLYRFPLEPNRDGFIEATFLGRTTAEFGLLDGLAVVPGDVTIAPIPVPAALPLLGAGLFGLAALGRLRRRKAAEA